MRTAAVLFLICFVASAQTGQQEPFSGPPQAKRGYTLFFEATKGPACGSCHAMAGRGNAAAPDLKRIARISPPGFVMAIKSTVTQYVKELKPVTGETFPIMPVKEDEKTVEVWDLSKTPPELSKMDRAEIDSIRDNSIWKHPPASAGYTGAELADIIAFIKWVGYRSTSEIKPDDL